MVFIYWDRCMLVALEDVACVDLLFHIVEHTVVTVGHNSLTSPFELLQVVHNQTAEEGGAIVERRFVYDNRGT